MDFEMTKLLITGTLQLFVALGAWTIAIAVYRGNSHKQNEDLKIKLYDRRYEAYLGFKGFVEHCFANDMPSKESFETFGERTQKLTFLFGKEIDGYKKEIVANAVTIVGIATNAPCSATPVVGGIVGYFPGSSTFDNLSKLRNWFHEQFRKDVDAYFEPYLDFSRAGVDVSKRKIKPRTLPDSPILRRKATSEGT